MAFKWLLTHSLDRSTRYYELERCPVEVRRNMMRKVLADELTGLGVDLPKKKLETLIQSLT